MSRIYIDTKMEIRAGLSKGNCGISIASRSPRRYPIVYSQPLQSPDLSQPSSRAIQMPPATGIMPFHGSSMESGAVQSALMSISARYGCSLGLFHFCIEIGGGSRQRKCCREALDNFCEDPTNSKRGLGRLDG